MSTPPKNTLTLDGREVAFRNERNLLEVIRKAGIDLPTFCYHSDLSVYGACRLCLVDIQGRGIQGACSTPPEPGMTVRTRTEEIREIRKISVELLLANHDQQCPTCPKSSACQLQELARKLGIENVRFKQVHQPEPVDRSSHSLVRDPGKCVLCGDCVRFCSEIQDIGAIDFAHRGHTAAVLPAFGQNLGEVECVNCGQCAALCPTGALSPKSETDAVWKALHNPALTVVAQIAPAVRVALGEAFGLPSGPDTSGRIVAALKQIGFQRVFDTAFSADLTIVEEAGEFLQRKSRGENLPQFTSCCPAWVKFAEQYYPDLLPRVSSCKSPQQMLGAMCKEFLPEEMGLAREKLVVVSIMPCTAKKFEARRPEFAPGGIPDIDHVLTTQELARMIQEAGLRFNRLQPAPFDSPMGATTGSGVIFGNSGGVSEAVLRYAAGILGGGAPAEIEYEAVRGEDGLRMATLQVAGVTLKLAVVHGLRNARVLAEKVRRGECDLDLIEVMACPGGCVGGAGQPVSRDPETRRDRAKGLYTADRAQAKRCSQDNPDVTDCYARHLGSIGGPKAHHLLHTHYQSRRRCADEPLLLGDGPPEGKLQVRVCVGTSCFLKGAQPLLHDLLAHVETEALAGRVEVGASFCFEQCANGPTVTVDGQAIHQCTSAQAKAAIAAKLSNRPL